MRLIHTALVVGLLAGCASEQWTYSRPGLTPARLDADLGYCRREAHRPQWFSISRSGRVDQAALNRCMEGKGYTARRDD